MNLVILDTSIFVNELRTGRHRRQIESITGIVRTSAVVLAELRRGATTPLEWKFLRALARNHPVVVPTEKNWVESGQILAKVRESVGYTGDKLRDLHFDTLIAVTARTCGARLITANRKDFELIRRYHRFELEIW